MLKCFIGFDPRQPIAFQVCAQSVWENASQPVSITRLDLRTLPIKRMGLTQFTYSRFLVPYLSNFEGRSLFLDSDILVRCDVCYLSEAAFADGANVAMVLHEGKLKFERPAVMLFENAECRRLTPEFIETQNPFVMEWARPEPLRRHFNHLVGYDPPNPDAKIVHFTKGIPIWDETRNCEFSAEWWECMKRCNSSVSHQDLMGRSVHVSNGAK